MTLGGPSTSAGNRPGRRTHFSRCPGAQGRVPVGRWRPRRRGAGRQAWPRPQGGHWPALGQPAGPPCPAGLATQQDWTPGPRAAVPAPGPRGAYLTPSAGGALAGRVARRLRVPTATAERAPSRQERGREEVGGWGERKREREISRGSHIAFSNVALEIRQVSILPQTHSWSSDKSIPR